MEELHIIGADLAKRVFQVHGLDRAGHVLFRKKLTRPQFTKFLREIPNCTIAIEVCAAFRDLGPSLGARGGRSRSYRSVLSQSFVGRRPDRAVVGERHRNFR